MQKLTIGALLLGIRINQTILYHITITNPKKLDYTLLSKYLDNTQNPIRRIMIMLELNRLDSSSYSAKLFVKADAVEIQKLMLNKQYLC